MNKPLRVLITESAQNDIISITDYIAKDNSTAASSIIDAFRKTFEILSIYPETGTVRKKIKNKSVRIYTIKKKFTIVYRLNNEQLEILRILTKYQNIFSVL